MTKTLKLSEAQLYALELIAEAPLHRWNGGFWAPKDEPFQKRSMTGSRAWGARMFNMPDRYVAVQTIQGLERRGFVERCMEDSREWFDPRKITDAGRAVSSAVSR